MKGYLDWVKPKQGLRQSNAHDISCLVSFRQPTNACRYLVKPEPMKLWRWSCLAMAATNLLKSLFSWRVCLIRRVSWTSLQFATVKSENFVSIGKTNFYANHSWSNIFARKVDTIWSEKTSGLFEIRQFVTSRRGDTRRKQLTCNDFVTRQDTQESCSCK